jgi:hypothetical protein
MSYQVDSYGNAYFPAGVSVASIPATTGTQNKVLVPGPGGKISSASISQLITQSGGNLVSSIFGRTGVITAQQGDYNTDQVTEGQALYFSTSRARKSIFLTTFNTSGPATYDSGTGILNIPQYGSGSGGNYVPLTRTITINGQTADLSSDRIFSVDPMVYPSIGIPLSNGTSWGTSIVNNSSNWNTAYSWGNHAGLYSLLGHTHTFASLTSKPTTLAGYGITDAATSAQGTKADTAFGWGNHALAGYLTSFTETDPIWISEKVNYYTKTQADARYLQSYTETDPIWTSEKANYALKTYVDTSISNLVASAPAALNTLNELALALGSDANFSTTITTLIGTKEPAITAGTTTQYWRGDKTWQTLPIYSLPIASTTVLGGVKVDGTTITINGSGVISGANTYSLPIASGTVLGGIKVGTNLSIDANGVLSSTDTNTTYANFTRTVAGLVPNPGGSTTNRYLREDGTWVIPPDNDTVYVHPTTAGNKHIPAGGSAGEILRWSADGTAVWGADIDTNTWNANTKDVAGYVAAPGAIANKVWKTDASGNPAWRDDADTDTIYTLPTATGSVLGGVKIGNGISISSGVISNYIYDTRNTRGATRLYRRDDDSDYSVQTYWTGTHWFLRGYNGDTFHAETRVSYSDSTGSVAWSNVSGRPTAVSSFTNDASYITSASNVVGVYASGYGNGNYTWYQTSGTFAGYTGWASYLISNHGDGSNYYNQTIIMPFWGAPQYSRREANVLKGPYGFITDENISTQSVNYSASSGSVAWTNVSGRPSALSSFTNDLGNYGSWYSTSGGTISGNVVINGSSNAALTINEAQPYLELNATGASNTAGVRIYPTAGYDANIGNYRGGALNLLSNSVVVAKVTHNAGVIFYVGGTGPITAVGTNTSAYNIFVNSSASNKTWDISLYNNDWILNESNVTSRLKVLAGGGVYADAFYEFSDKRFKTLVKEDPIINIGSITSKLYVKEGKTELGYYAQDFIGVLDSAILTDKDGVLSLSYRQVHTAKIAALEKRIAELETKLNSHGL